MPDHAVEVEPGLADRSGLVLALDVDDTDDLTVNLRDKLDALLLIALLRLPHIVEESRLEEGEDPADDPVALIRVAVRPNDETRIAVHEAARVCAAAGPGEILVSEATKSLAAGALLSFADRGVHELKGIDGPRRLYAYASEEPQSE